MTPEELFTKQFMEALEQEAKLSEKEIQDRFADAFKILVALYFTGNKSAGYSFRLPKSSSIIFEELRKDVRAIFERRTANAVNLSKVKNTKILNRVIKDPKLGNWLDRIIQERTLNQRILKATNAFKMEVEARIAIGIANGESEASMIRTVEKFLLEPYSFLSVEKRADYEARRLAIKFSPKTGTYKSAYANAKRLVRSEVFEAYRRADYLIWSNANEVVGIRVYLNPAHPMVDSCDYLVGDYPKDFFFCGFHPACICLSRPYTRGEAISEIPESAKEYMSQEKTQKWYGKLPFITNNNKYWDL